MVLVLGTCLVTHIIKKIYDFILNKFKKLKVRM
jgi:hypothetical protein